MIDFARKPARQQAVPLNRIEVLIRRLCYLLAQKEIRMHNQKTCAYHLCGKTIEQGKEVKSPLLYRKGSQLARKEKEYCSRQCAEYDQMAHES
ncbi:hypothetical protein SEEN4881_03977 [Salmonella enterica subsp. enterica serovar Newport str. WA_14881]|nr:hypothetical protein SEEN4881_03977 [Salmonella enterica subsp. enterica serovar Newport str. WA_14881]